MLSVKKDGIDEPYHTSRENGNFVIYIGDGDVILARGIYEYEIISETQRQIGFFEDFDELYWNVNGNYWSMPIDQVSATIHLPEGAKIAQNSCYTGLYGSTSTNCYTQILSETSLKWSAQNLTTGEGLTIAVEISKGSIQEPQLPGFLKSENLSKILVGFLGVLLLIFGFQWHRHGIDPEKPTFIPRFEPPQNLSPASIGYLNKGSYSKKFITASLVNLAVQGYLKITETKESQVFGLLNNRVFKLTKIKIDRDLLSEEESSLLNNFSGATMEIDGKYDPKIASMVLDYQEKITKKNKELVHKGNNRSKVILPFLLISLIYWIILIVSYLHLYNLNKFILGCVIFGVTFVLYTILVTIPTLRYKSLLFWLLPVFPLGLFILYWYFFDKQIDPFNLAYFFLLVSFFLLTLFKYLIEKPDSELLKLKSEIEGFKMYLSSAESHLLKYHNPPQLTPAIFEKMLPYAIVLGVDKIWGEKFDELLKVTQSDYSNTWFLGNTHNFTSNISNSFGNSLTSSITSASTMPSSSGSGSGGGGSSGGGGGGGGGGGW